MLRLLEDACGVSSAHVGLLLDDVDWVLHVDLPILAGEVLVHDVLEMGVMKMISLRPHLLGCVWLIHCSSPVLHRFLTGLELVHLRLGLVESVLLGVVVEVSVRVRILLIEVLADAAADLSAVADLPWDFSRSLLVESVPLLAHQAFRMLETVALLDLLCQHCFLLFLSLQRRLRGLMHIQVQVRISVDEVRLLPFN